MSMLRASYVAWRAEKQNSARAQRINTVPFSRSALEREARLAISSIETVHEAIFFSLAASPDEVRFPFELAAAFPPDVPESPYLVALCTAVNDFRSSARLMTFAKQWEAQPAKEHLANGAYMYAFRMACFHLFECSVVMSAGKAAVRSYFQSLVERWGPEPAERRDTIAGVLNERAKRLHSVRNQLAAHYADDDYIPAWISALATARNEKLQTALVGGRSGFNEHIELADQLLSIRLDELVGTGFDRSRALVDFMALQIELGGLCNFVLQVRLVDAGLLQLPDTAEQRREFWPAAYDKQPWPEPMSSK